MSGIVASPAFTEANNVLLFIRPPSLYRIKKEALVGYCHINIRHIQSMVFFIPNQFLSTDLVFMQKRTRETCTIYPWCASGVWIVKRLIFTGYIIAWGACWVQGLLRDARSAWGPECPINHLKVDPETKYKQHIWTAHRYSATPINTLLTVIL